MFWRNLESDESCSNVLTGSPRTQHVSVLLDEVLNYLECAPGKNYLDLTLGGGGHSRAILEKTTPDGKLFAFDRDQDAIGRTTAFLREFEHRIKIFHKPFDQVGVLADLPEIHGAVIDCGISSDQLETPSRGFSFNTDGPLDMRMDDTTGPSVQQWLHGAKEQEIANVIYQYGEERLSRRIAKQIVEAKGRNELNTTTDLADIVSKAYGSRAHKQKIHPATRTFQALRIFINDELGQLERAISTLGDVMANHGRVVIITFHSLEDRIVKHKFRQMKTEGHGIIITKKPVIPSQVEIERNPRSRSAKLRVFEYIKDRT